MWKPGDGLFARLTEIDKYYSEIEASHAMIRMEKKQEQAEKAAKKAALRAYREQKKEEKELEKQKKIEAAAKAREEMLARLRQEEQIHEETGICAAIKLTDSDFLCIHEAKYTEKGIKINAFVVMKRGDGISLSEHFDITDTLVDEDGEVLFDYAQWDITLTKEDLDRALTGQYIFYADEDFDTADTNDSEDDSEIKEDGNLSEKSCNATADEPASSSRDNPLNEPVRSSGNNSPNEPVCSSDDNSSKKPAGSSDGNPSKATAGSSGDTSSSSCFLLIIFLISLIAVVVSGIKMLIGSGEQIRNADVFWVNLVGLIGVFFDLGRPAKNKRPLDNKTNKGKRNIVLSVLHYFISFIGYGLILYALLFWAGVILGIKGSPMGLVLVTYTLVIIGQLLIWMARKLT